MVLKNAVIERLKWTNASHMNTMWYTLAATNSTGFKERHTKILSLKSALWSNCCSLLTFKRMPHDSIHSFRRQAPGVMAPQADNGSGTDAFFTDPWVITFERVFVPGETTLMDICETYEDVLQKYGCIHLPGLVRKVCAERRYRYIV